VTSVLFLPVYITVPFYTVANQQATIAIHSLSLSWPPLADRTHTTGELTIGIESLASTSSPTPQLLS